MLEIPEAQTIAGQLKKTVVGKTIKQAVAAASPHGFAWYFGDSALYGDVLNGRKITDTAAYGGRPEIWAGDMRISFGDGVNVRYFAAGAKRPLKHQLLLEFDSGDAICCTVQMYGGLWAFEDGANNDFYYTVAKEKPSPLSDAFDRAYFNSLLTGDTQKLPAKAFLATEQRIPGLGNGVLQDILWRAKIHPKRKMSTLSDGEFETMYSTVKSLLSEMTALGGRDTEKDLFGNPGGYITTMSKKNDGMPCPICGGLIRRLAYMGGNVYVCEGCQKLEVRS
ncbi:MAG: endonuclease VIII [Clostridiales bacterium]|jgi:formamidopyrimidine-DNA glycosylase|nr:endonuclease VIII [Clostridiales bacterium]